MRLLSCARSTAHAVETERKVVKDQGEYQHISAMGGLQSKLYWSETQEDGSPRAIWAQLIDPVGACVQPADLGSFNPADEIDIPAPADERLYHENNITSEPEGPGGDE